LEAVAEVAEGEAVGVQPLHQLGAAAAAATL